MNFSMTTSLRLNMKLKLLQSVVLLSCVIGPLAEDRAVIAANATNQFTISGMHCDGCAGGLTAELKLVPGVASAQVTFSNKLAVVTYDTNKVTMAKLNAAIKEAGFTATTAKP
jgi:copper chaperone CopZ